jgi:radical SAM superfamily enzyme YgiQ (UPF0313 family)
MTWKIRESYRKKLAAEEGYHPTTRGGALSVCLVYPNRYHVGMSNLGFHSVYRLLNDTPGVVCERAFFPDTEEMKEYLTSGCRLMSLETQRDLASFDLIAFSISFEHDYLNLPRIFQLAGIPPLAEERDSSHPLLMAGGAALFLNPEPVADFLDLAVLGEAEPTLAPLLTLLSGAGDRHLLLAAAAQLPGIYVPSLLVPRYENGLLCGWDACAGAPERVRRVWVATSATAASSTAIFTPDTEFGDMALVEVSRGCPRGCRFCAAGFIYLPFRQQPLDAVLKQVDEGLTFRNKIGLVGAAVSDYAELGTLSRAILDKGGTISVSSLRMDGLNDEMIDVLIKSGHKTVALAPEGGSQRLRDLMNKGITLDDILAACDRLIEKDILNLKLYFIIGLPTETDEDLEEMVQLIRIIRERVVTAAKKNRRLGEILLSVNPFIPKPFTPFQWCGMNSLKELERKEASLQRSFRSMANVRFQMETPREALLQAFLSRGDRTLSRFILKTHELGSCRKGAKALKIDPELSAVKEIPRQELLPWDFMESVSRERLIREFEAAFGDACPGAGDKRL